MQTRLWILTVSGLLAAACSDPGTPTDPNALSGEFRNGEVGLAYTLDLPTGQPPFSAVVVAHGSGRVTRDEMKPFADRFVQHGYAVLRYDKRGVGQSGGVYSGVSAANSPSMIPLLAGDLAAGVRFLASRSDIDHGRIGFVGASQAGWIIPMAATLAPGASFAVILVGPTTSVGAEIFYSQLAEGSSLSFDDLSAQLATFTGPHGFDPAATLLQTSIPIVWLYGAMDRSIPTRESVAILNQLISRQGKPFSVIVYPNGDHGLTDVVNRAPIDIWPDIYHWLDATP